MNVLPDKLKDAPSLLDHMCRLDFTKSSDFRRMSGIIATIGPTSRDEETIYQMIKFGASVIRINFSHENHQDHLLTLECLRKAIERYSTELSYNCNVAIAGDLKGRTVRTGILSGRKSVELKRGDPVKFSINPDLANKCTKDVIYVDYPGIIQDVEAGHRVYLDDSALVAEIREVGVDCLMCQVLVGGILGDKVSVVVPGVALRLPVVSEKDAFDIKFCVEHNFDFIFLSKMRSEEEILEVRRKIGKRGKHMKVITKIENAQALANLDGIFSASDAILIARADMGIELKVSKIFLAQKAIVARCNRLGIPVICGTQLLMSMNDSPVPTRSDVCDIGNALLDGTDSLLLSSETAIGLYPIETVKTLAHTCREAEAALWHRKLFLDLIEHNPAAVEGAHAVAISAVTASVNVEAAAIVVITVSGRSAQLVSSYRPRCPIFAVTRCSRVARQANICRGLIPVLVTANRNDDYLQDVESRINYTLTVGYHMGIVKNGDAIVVLSPWKHSTGFTNNIHIVYAYFEKDPIDCLQEKKTQLSEKAPGGQRFLGV